MEDGHDKLCSHSRHRWGHAGSLESSAVDMDMDLMHYPMLKAPDHAQESWCTMDYVAPVPYDTAPVHHGISAEELPQVLTGLSMGV